MSRRGQSHSADPLARRISGCSLTFFADRDGAQIKSRGGFVKSEITMASTFDDQPTLWQDRVLLDEDFYRALREHPVPVSETALRGTERFAECDEHSVPGRPPASF